MLTVIPQASPMFLTHVAIREEPLVSVGAGTGSSIFFETDSKPFHLNERNPFPRRLLTAKHPTRKKVEAHSKRICES